MKHFVKISMFLCGLSVVADAVQAQLPAETIASLAALARAEKESGIKHTHAIVLAPVVRALCGAADYKEFGGRETLTLRSVNPLVRALKSMIRDGSTSQEIIALFGLDQFSEKELMAVASPNFSELNELLAKRGFDIRLGEPATSDAFGVVSILDVLGEWLVQGSNAEPIQYADKNYAAFKLSGRGFAGFKVPGHANLIIALDTKNGDKVYITIPDRAYGGFELLHYITDLLGRDRAFVNEYAGVIVPEVNLDELGDISYLVGASLFTHQSDYVVMEALQQSKLAMNKNGFRAQSAVAIAICRSSGLVYKKKHYKVDQPFVIAIVRAGVAIPYFVAYVTPPFWQSPGDDLNNPNKALPVTGTDPFAWVAPR